MILGIEHTAIMTPNARRLANWYVEHLGFAVNYMADGGKAMFVKASDGSMIEIVEVAEGASPKPAMRDPGLRHLALAVTDFQQVYEALKAKGVPFLTEMTTVSGNTTAFFTDCDGNILHLLHREQPLP